MGLDMYLSQSRHIANYEHDPEGQKLAKGVMDALGITAEVQERYKDGSLTVRLPAAYWREANAIHGWFVQNVQEGEDDCEEYYVALDQLQGLRSLCQDVLDGKQPKDELPPTRGFFFGNTEDDEYYRQDLKDTVEMLDKIIADPDSKKHSFYYQSSR